MALVDPTNPRAMAEYRKAIAEAMNDPQKFLWPTPLRDMVDASLTFPFRYPSAMTNQESDDGQR